MSNLIYNSPLALGLLKLSILSSLKIGIPSFFTVFIVFGFTISSRGTINFLESKAIIVIGSQQRAYIKLILAI